MLGHHLLSPGLQTSFFTPRVNNLFAILKRDLIYPYRWMALSNHELRQELLALMWFVCLFWQSITELDAYDARQMRRQLKCLMHYSGLIRVWPHSMYNWKHAGCLVLGGCGCVIEWGLVGSNQRRCVCDEFHLALISALSKPDGNPTLEGRNSKQPANQCHEDVKGW